MLQRTPRRLHPPPICPSSRTSPGAIVTTTNLPCPCPHASDSARVRARVRLGCRTGPASHALWALLLSAAVACADTAPSTNAQTRYSVSEGAEQGLCTDIAETRVCWRGAAMPVLVPRTVPRGAAPPQGWRCGTEDAAAATRVCEDRGKNASAFVCGSQRCLQARPRMPDDGEWECVEMSGVVYCHSRGEAAGVAAGPRDLGWLCGARREGAAGERVCVDFDADRPTPLAAGRCRFELHVGMQQRSCTVAPIAAAASVARVARVASVARVGSPCDASTSCPEGSACRAGLCLPARPEPACWLDGDCGLGARCTFGSCVRSGA